MKKTCKRSLALVLSLLMLFAIVFVYNAKSLSRLLHRFLPRVRLRSSTVPIMKMS